MNTGCLISKGKRRDAEEHFSSLSDLYPTKNVEDLFEKYPEGGTLSHSIFTNEGEVGYKYYYTFKIDSINKTITGYEKKKIYKSGEFTEIYTVPVEYKNGEIIYLENPELENHKITFLFENLDYKEIIKYKFKDSSYGIDSGMYTLSYYVPVEVSRQYLDTTKECIPSMLITSKSSGFPDIRFDSIKCSESITETFEIGK